METQLVSFGNYLLSNYGVQVHSTDGKNTPLYQRQVSDADLSNWKLTQPKGQPDYEKILECLHIIEGIFHGYGVREGLENSLTMANNGREIYFELYEKDNRASFSEPLDRKWLESLDCIELTKVILNSLNMLTGKDGGGVPYKKHTNFPSRYKIGEEVKFYIPKGNVLLNAKVTSVHFTESKVKYDLEVNFYEDYVTRVYNIDSILLKDLDFTGDEK